MCGNHESGINFYNKVSELAAVEQAGGEAEAAKLAEKVAAKVQAAAEKATAERAAAVKRLQWRTMRRKLN